MRYTYVTMKNSEALRPLQVKEIAQRSNVSNSPTMIVLIHGIALGWGKCFSRVPRMALVMWVDECRHFGRIRRAGVKIPENPVYERDKNEQVAEEQR